MLEHGRCGHHETQVHAKQATGAKGEFPVSLLTSTRNVELEKYNVSVLNHISFPFLFIFSSSLTDKYNKEQ
jgi:hypothetical protein